VKAANPSSVKLPWSSSGDREIGGLEMEVRNRSRKWFRCDFWARKTSGRGSFCTATNVPHFEGTN